MFKMIFLFFAAMSVAGAEPMRALDLQGAPNLRDVGGYETADGRHVKWQRVYRSSDLARLTTADAKTVADLHIVSVVDLRTRDERRQAPDVWLHAPKDLYESQQQTLAPLLHSILLDAKTTAGVRAGFINFYSTMPDLYKTEYGAFFRRIAAGQLPILVHCTAGKDRTGVAVALLLTSLGVPHWQVLDDYALTETLLGPPPAAVTTTTPTTNAAAVPVGGPAQAVIAQLPEESRRVLWRSDREYVEAALNSIDHEYGSVDAYLRGLGLSAAEITSLRTSLLQ